MISADLVASFPTACVLGEGPVWDHRTGWLWFTDIQQSRLHRLDWASRRLECFAMPERLGSLALTHDPAVLLCALASGFAMVTPSTGTCNWLARTEPVYRGIRMNDGRCDRQGRFWAGSMVEDKGRAAGSGGSLYRLDPGSTADPQALLGGIAISNAICFSPAGDALYFTDTPSQIIRRFMLDPDTGAISEGRNFAILSGNAYPDGADVDASGRLWNAEWGSGRVTAYAPDGSISGQITLPVSQVTCVAFGGPDLDLLFVTTAREGLSGDRLAAEPQAGDLFVYHVGAHGLTTPVFGRG